MFGYRVSTIVVQGRLGKRRNWALYRADQQVQPTDGVGGGELDKVTTNCGGQWVPNNNEKPLYKKVFRGKLYHHPKGHVGDWEGKGACVCTVQSKGHTCTPTHRQIRYSHPLYQNHHSAPSTPVTYHSRPPHQPPYHSLYALANCTNPNYPSSCRQLINLSG